MGLIPWVGLKVCTKAKIKLFLEYGHVAYQIKADDACRYMVANILPTDIPSTPRGGVKRSFFLFSESGNVSYQIKVKEV